MAPFRSYLRSLDAQHGSALLTLVVLGAPGCGLLSSDLAPVGMPRPLPMTDSGTQPEGTLGLEAGVAGDPGESLSTPVTVLYGLSPAIEVFVETIPYRSVDRPGGAHGRGFGDEVVGLRQRVYGEASASDGLSLGWEGVVTIPTGDVDEGTSSGEYGFLGSLLVDWVAGPSMTSFNYLLGVLGDPDDSGHDLQHVLSLGSTLSLTEAWSAYGAVQGVWVGAQSENPVEAFLGVQYGPSPAWVWDAGISLGLNDDAPDRVYTFGVTIDFGQLFARDDDGDA